MPTRDEINSYLDELLPQFPNVPRPIAENLIGTESSGNPNAVSYKGAMGMTQLMPATAREMGVTDPLDWKSNIAGGVGYLSKQIDRFGDVDRGLAAYHAGPQRVADNLAAGGSGIPNTSDGYMTTPDYVRKVTGRQLPSDQPSFQNAMLTRTLPSANKAPGAAALPPDVNEFGRLVTPIQSSAPVEPPSIFKEAANELWGGVGQFGEDLRGLVNATLGETVTKKIDELGETLGMPPVDTITKQAEAARTPQMREAVAKDWVTEDQDGMHWGPAFTDWRSYMSGVLGSLPETYGMMAPAITAAKTAATIAGRLATRKALEQGLSAAVAKTMAEQAANKAADAAAFVVGNQIESGLAGGQTFRQVQSDIMAMPQSVLDTSDVYKQLVVENGGDRDAARAQLARDQATQGFAMGYLATVPFSGIGDVAIARAFRGQLEGGIFKRLAKTAASEGGEEVFQNYGQQVAQNVAEQAANPAIPTTEGALNQAVGGGIAGALMGAPAAVLPGRPEAAPPPRAAPPGTTPAAPGATPAAPTEPPAAPLPPGMQEGDIGRKDGQPFAAKMPAVGQLKRMGIEDTHEVVPTDVGNGYVIRPKGVPTALPEVAGMTDEEVAAKLAEAAKAEQAPAGPEGEEAVTVAPAVPEAPGHPIPPAPETITPTGETTPTQNGTEPAKPETITPVPETTPAQQFNSTQVAMPAGIAMDVKQAAKKIIAKADIDPEHGLEDRPHVTVKYGLHENAPDAVRKLVENEPPIEGKIGKLDVFSPEGKNYDVLVARVESPDLHRLNAKINALPHTDTFPTYEPHVTLGYVKRGEGAKYATAKNPLEGRSFKINTLEFTDQNEKITPIKLGQKPKVETPEAKAQAWFKEKMRPYFERGDTEEQMSNSMQGYGGGSEGYAIRSHKATVKLGGQTHVFNLKKLWAEWEAEWKASPNYISPQDRRKNENAEAAKKWKVGDWVTTGLAIGDRVDGKGKQKTSYISGLGGTIKAVTPEHIDIEMNPHGRTDNPALVRVEPIFVHQDYSKGKVAPETPTTPKGEGTDWSKLPHTEQAAFDYINARLPEGAKLDGDAKGGYALHVGSTNVYFDFKRLSQDAAKEIEKQAIETLAEKAQQPKVPAPPISEADKLAMKRTNAIKALEEAADKATKAGAANLAQTLAHLSSRVGTTHVTSLAPGRALEIAGRIDKLIERAQANPKDTFTDLLPAHKMTSQEKRNLEAEAARKAKAAEQHLRTAQSDAWNALANNEALNDLASKTPDAFEAGAREHLGAWIAEAKKNGDADRVAALEALQKEQPPKFWPSLQKEVAKRAARAAREAAKAAAAAKKKLVNTGVDLRRYWDKLKEETKAKNDAEGITGLNKVYTATTRADLFRDLLPETATPGAKQLVDLFRDKTPTFKEWITRSNSGPLRNLSGPWGKSQAEELEGFVRGTFNVSRTTSREVFRGIIADETLDAEGFDPKTATVQDRLTAVVNLGSDYATQVGQLTALVKGKEKAGDVATAIQDFLWARENLKEGSYPSDRWLSRLVPNSPADILQKAGILTDDHAFFSPGSYRLKHIITNEDTAQAKVRKEPLLPPRLERTVRTGLPELRKGDVEAKKVKSTFGFADVGFGTWVNSKEDHSHLNAASDAFHDLAAFLGIDPTWIGFKGKLHFTIGALGHGSKAAATFHPAHPGPEGKTVQVINLTKTKGDGTVAHEWGHAFDHFVSGTEGGQVIREVVAALKTQFDYEYVRQRAISALKGNTGWWKRGGKPMYPAIETAERIIRYNRNQGRRTNYKAEADKLGEDYWGNDAELFARAWESWISDNLGGVDNYLVNPAWVGDGMVMPPRHRGTPYPRAEERKTFAKWFDALKASLTEKDGMLTLDVERWKANKPFDKVAYDTAIDNLIADLPMLYEQIKREDEAERVASEKAKADAAAAALREQEAVNPPTSVIPTDTALKEDDLEDLFDAAAEDLKAENAENALAPEPGTSALNQTTEPAPPKAPVEMKQPRAPAGTTEGGQFKAGELIAEAAKQGVKGVDEALTGLTKLFGGGKIQSFPGGFDEATYKEAKPHFEAALKAFQAAGKTLKDLFKLLIQQFGEGIKPYAIRFAQDMKLTSDLGKPASATAAIADWVKGELDQRHPLDSNKLFTKANEAFGGTLAEGKYDVKDAYDAAEAGMNQWILTRPATQFTVSGPSERAVGEVHDLMVYTQKMPTQTRRTAEMDEYQQFSTVPALAYVANWVAHITPGETMLEPSAGVGGIAVFAQRAGANIVANELSSKRAAVLREVLPDARVFTENAEQINNILPDDVKPTVVVMNPPFSATAGRIEGERSNKNGAQHIEQALSRLQPGGRLVTIMGEGFSTDAPSLAAWWKDIKAKYNVRADIWVNGKGYAKYGTSFDNRIIVIDKTGPTVAPIVTGRAEAYAELPPLLQGVRNDRRLPTADSIAPQSGAAEPASGGASTPGLEGAETGGPVGPAVGPVGDHGGQPPAVTGGQGAGANVSGPGEGHAQPPAGGGRHGATGRRPGRPGPETGGVSDTGRNPNAPSDLALDVAGNEKRNAELSDAIFEAYEPRKAKIVGSKPHPGLLVESSAMAAVEPIDATYTPNLPKEVIASGDLSDAQLEAIIYAGQAHEQMMPDGTRRAYFIGDGTGVGKGREISGVIMDNMRRGRDKAVWLSASTGLFTDAIRDWTGIGGKKDQLFQLRDPSSGGADAKGKVTRGEGIMFTTYSTLRGGEKTQTEDLGFGKNANVITSTGASFKLVGIDAKKKLVRVKVKDAIETVPFNKVTSIGGDSSWQKTFETKKGEAQTSVKQILDWLGPDFDGVLAFDEAHRIKNLGGKGKVGKVEPSKQALDAQELRKKLPKARILYVSATGATEVDNLSYADRLGLWGEGTSFATAADFINKIGAKGLAAMELVARDMKGMGAYISRALSYDGVEYNEIDASFTPLQKEIYDELAGYWQIILKNVEAALETTKQNKDSRAKMRARGAFFSTEQRFFNQVITSMMAPATLERARAEIEAGKAVLFQMVNTNESQQERMIAEAEADGTEIEELDFTPKQSMIEFMKNAYPVAQFEEYTDDNGNKKSRPVYDSEGKPVQNKALVAERDAHIKHIEDNLRVPGNPIDMVYETFGEDAVGEVSGRKSRYFRKVNKDGSFTMEERKRGDKSNAADAKAFMDDKKKVLIFTTAGGTGYSFDSDRKVKNQRRRFHVMLQTGWSAETNMQGVGRSHRSNEANQPIVALPRSDLKAQKRFISSIARRLDQLGALTKGQRNTASQGLFRANDNLESKYAVAALRQLMEDMAPVHSAIPNSQELIDAMGLKDIYDPKEGTLLDGKMPEMTRFLNRMLALKIAQQDQIFGEFETRMDAAVEAAIQNGTYDDGMRTVHALKIEKARDDTVYEDPRTKAKTRFVELNLTKAATLNDWDEVQTLIDRYPGKGFGYYFDNQTGQPFAMVDLGNRTDANGRPFSRAYRFNVRAPSLASRGQYIENRQSIEQGGTTHVFRQEPFVPGPLQQGLVPNPLEKRGPRYRKITPDEATYLWKEAYDAAPKTVKDSMAMLTGALLPVWDRIELSQGEKAASVVRTQTDDGERLIGLQVPPEQRKEILKNFGLGAVKADTPTPDLIARIMDGEQAQLSNGWMLKKSRVAGESRIEIVASYLSSSEQKLLVTQGAIHERIQYRDRFFIPINDEAVFERITRGSNRPIVDFVGEPEAKFSAAEPTAQEQPRGTIRNDKEATAAVEALRSVLEREIRKQNPGYSLPAGAFQPVTLPHDQALQRIAGAFGKSVVGFRVAPAFLKEAGFFNGVTRIKGAENVIFLREDSQRPHLSILGHELGHQLKADKPNLYAQLVQQLRGFMRQDKFAEEFGKSAKAWEGRSVDALREEFVGEVIGDGLMSRTFWNEIKARKPGLFQWLRNAVLMLIDKVRRTTGYAPRVEKYVTDYDKVMSLAGATMAQYGTEPADVTNTGPGGPLFAGKSSPLWRSALAEGIAAKGPFSKAGTVPVDQLRKWVAARVKEGLFKQEEIDATGFGDWLDGQKGTVTRAQVGDYLEQHGVKVNETMLGEGAHTDGTPAAEIDRLTVELTASGYTPETDHEGVLIGITRNSDQVFFNPIEENGLHWEAEDIDGKDSDAVLPDDIAEKARLLGELRDDLVNERAPTTGDTRYSNWQLPGGKNYRELLLKKPENWGATVPPLSFEDWHARTHTGAVPAVGTELRRIADLQYEREKYALRRDTTFNAPHFGNEGVNLLAHVRFNERTDADGRKVLFIEEFQSDWAQKGRKQGFTTKADADAVDKLTKEWQQWLRDNNLPQVSADELRAADLTNQQQRYVGTFMRAWDKAQGMQGVPAAPFVQRTESWVGLALKRMIRYAIDNGFDRIAWTNGEQQAARYDLSKVISSLKYTETSDGVYHVSFIQKGGHAEWRTLGTFKEAQLPDAIGKDLAQKIVNGEGEMIPHTGFKRLDGNDLKIGGEGMRSFYDKIVPNVANDILKKMGGGRVSDIGVLGGDVPAEPVAWGDSLERSQHPERFKKEALTQPGFDITPAMREAAGEGLPMFSAIDDTLNRLPGMARNKVTDGIEAMLRSTNTFNLWHRTVGTQFHKAWVDKDFRPVFEAGQDFVRDTSQFAMNAGARAPDLLPRLEHLSDAAKQLFRTKAQKADVRAAANATFMATLGGIRPSARMLLNGFEVTTPDGPVVVEPLTERQVELFQEARALIDHSIDDLAGSIAASLVRRTSAFNQNVTKLARDDPDHAQALYYAEFKRLGKLKVLDRGGLSNKELAGLQKDTMKVFEKAQNLKLQGYAPLMRFGRYAVEVDDEKGNVLYFSLHESQIDQKQAARELAADPQFAKAAVSQYTIPQERWKLFQGISPETLALFGETAGLSQDEVFQKYLRTVVATRSALKRMIHRKGRAGYNEDLQRVLAQFATSNARFASRNYNWGKMLDAVAAIPTTKGDVIDESTRLLKYLQNPDEEMQRVRSFLFINYLGGSIASALVNMTQPITMTAPYLSQFSNPAKATSSLLAAGKIASGFSKPDAEMAAMLERADKDGITAPHELYQMQAVAMQGFGAGPKTAGVMKLWGSLFSLAEAWNRRITFIAAYNMGKGMSAAQLAKAGATDAFSFAERAVQDTQGVYNRGNRPNWSRGPLGATLMTFKQFSISYIEFLVRLPRRERLLALGIMLVLAGGQGLPFAEDLENIIDTVGQSLGYNTNSRKALRNAATKVLGDTLGKGFTEGFSALPGVPLDVGGRVGVGNLIPGSGLLKRSEPDKTRELTQVLGPAGSFAAALGKGFQAATGGDVKGALTQAAPVAIQNAMKGAEMWQTGQYKDVRGRRVVDVDKADALLKAAGIQPSDVAEQRRREGYVQQDITLAKTVEGEIASKWAQGRVENDPEKVQAARDQLREWNQKNPEDPIVITGQQLAQRIKEMKMLSAQRIVKGTPPQMRGQVRSELR